MRQNFNIYPALRAATILTLEAARNVNIFPDLPAATTLTLRSAQDVKYFASPPGLQILILDAELALSSWPVLKLGR